MFSYGCITTISASYVEFPFCLHKRFIPDIQQVFFVTVLPVLMGNWNKKSLNACLKKRVKNYINIITIKKRIPCFIA